MSRIRSSKKSALSTKLKIKAIVEKELDQIPDLLTKMTESERVNAIIKLIPYIVPKATESLDENDVVDAMSDFIQRIKNADITTKKSNKEKQQAA